MTRVVSKGVVSQQERNRGKTYTPRQRKFLNLLVKSNFTNVVECAKKAGYSNGSHWAAVSTLKEDIKEISESILLGSAPEAALTLTKMIGSDEPIVNATAKLAAAKEVLDRAGIVKEDKLNVNHSATGGIFILPVKMSQPQIEEEDYYEGEYEETYDEYEEIEDGEA